MDPYLIVVFLGGAAAPAVNLRAQTEIQARMAFNLLRDAIGVVGIRILKTSHRGPSKLILEAGQCQ